MSVRAITAVWERSRQKGSGLLVMLAIADYAKDDGTNAYPSNAALQRKTRLCERAVRQNLSQLVESGELRIRVAAGPSGCNRYDLTLPTQPVEPPATEDPDERPDEGGGKDCPPESGVVRGAKFAPGGHQDAPGGGTTMPRGGAPGCPRSVIDPSEEHTSRARERDPADPRRSHPLDERPNAALMLSRDSLNRFDAILALYPRKDGRKKALEVWRKLDPAPDLTAEIMAAIRQRLAQGWARDSPIRFLPTLGTFLDGACWLEPYYPPEQKPLESEPGYRHVPSAEETARMLAAQQEGPILTAEERAAAWASIKERLQCKRA